MWHVRNWCKPFGEQSESRERLAIAAFLQEEIKRAAPKPPPERAYYTLPFQRRLRGAVDVGAAGRFCRQAVVKIKGYAHDRIVLSSYLQAPLFFGTKARTANLRRGAACPGSLDIPRESRQAIKIGSRLRNLPLKTGWTTNGRNWVRDAAHIAEHESKGQGVFLTFTYPGGTNEGYQIMSMASGYVVDRINRWLRYRVHHGCYCYVWELQERGAPHLHYLFRLPDGVAQDTFLLEVKAQWYKILCDISGQCQVDLFERKEGGSWMNYPDVLQVDIQELYGTYSKYMSKYISKTKSKGGLEHHWHPGRWWGISRESRRRVLLRRLDAVIKIDSTSSGLSVIRELIDRCRIIITADKWFARIPGCPSDAVSVQSRPMTGQPLARCLVHFLVFGDMTPLNLMLRPAPW